MAGKKEDVVETVHAPEPSMDAVIAEASKFIKEYTTVAAVLAKMLKNMSDWRQEAIRLENHKQAMRRFIQEGELRLADLERQGQSRLASLNDGHKAIIERLTQKENAVDTKSALLDKREHELQVLRAKYETLAAQAESKLVGIAATTAGKR